MHRSIEADEKGRDSELFSFTPLPLPTMVLGFLRRLFKSKKTYVLNDEESILEGDSVVFEKPSGTTPKLLNASALSPLMWRFIVTRSPAHPVDCEYEEDDEIVSRRTHTRASITSSDGYCSQTSNDSTPRLGATSMGDEEILVFSEESSPVTHRATSAGNIDFMPPPCTESSPEPTSVWSQLSPGPDHDTLPPESSTTKRVGFITMHAGRTPACFPNMLNTPTTLPPKTPYRADVARLEMRGRKVPSVPLENVESSDAKCTPVVYEQTTDYGVITPATLPPKTPYRDDRARNELRPARKPASAPILDLELLEEEEEDEMLVESSVVARESIWGEPEYSPASSTELDTSHTLHSCTPHRALSLLERISLRRRPSATVSGRVKQMVKFFESDSERHEVPRRLDHLPPEFMRSCPQIDNTPSPRVLHEHTHSDRVRGVTSASARCIRCVVHNRTPNSRRSMG